MKLLTDYSINELGKIVEGFRATQLFSWVAKGAKYDQMTNLSLKLREQLSAEYSDTSLSIIKELKGEKGASKFLYELNDGNVIEGVYMPHDYGNTLCVSTQVGCRMGCAFCASTIGGLVRNLSAGEMYAQVIEVNKLYAGNKRGIDKLVLMGSGEPLDNYDNVVKFIKLVTDERGLNLSQRGISLSTCGLCEGITRLADDGLSVNLAISLHATTDEIRVKLMPTGKRYGIDEIMRSARYYFDKTGRRIAIEYALIKGVNMGKDDARRLKNLLRGMSAHINLIMLNHVEESDLKPCSKGEVYQFLDELKSLNLSATIRASVLTSVEGACGQLRRSIGGCKGD